MPVAGGGGPGTIRKPLVLGTGEELLEELSNGDTISTTDISDSLNKRFVTDAEKASIGTGGGIAEELAIAYSIALG